jgi:CcmD family protein
MFTQVPATSSSSSSTVEDRSTTMKGTPASGESVPGGTLLVVAYAVVWIAVLLLILRVFQRQTAVGKRVDELEADLKKKR